MSNTKDNLLLILAIAFVLGALSAFGVLIYKATSDAIQSVNKPTKIIITEGVHGGEDNKKKLRIPFNPASPMPRVPGLNSF